MTLGVLVPPVQPVEAEAVACVEGYRLDVLAVCCRYDYGYF